MQLSCGIIGLPNVGKSTLFNALLKKQAAFVANYPFATIEPNIGVVPVPDKRLVQLAQITQSEHKMSTPPSIIPATVSFIDIAGLVKGAAEGQGLGNKFLSHIREIDAIVHVVRYFKDKSVVRSLDSTDAKNDFEVVNAELILADLETLSKQHEPKQNATKEEWHRFSAVKKLKEALNQGKLAKEVELSDEEKIQARELHLITAKPVITVANVDEEDLNKDLGEGAIAISAKIESELAELSEDEQTQYLKELGVEHSGLERLIQKSYKILNLISFLTAGVKEVRAWTIRADSTALTASGEIHTDFMKKFIKAEVVSYQDFVEYNGWKGSREMGKARLEGKDYIVKDGDVVEFKIGS